MDRRSASYGDRASSTSSWKLRVSSIKRLRHSSRAARYSSASARSKIRRNLPIRFGLGGPDRPTHTDGGCEAPERDLTAICEPEALARGELAHHVREQDLAAAGFGGDARGEDDGGTEEVAVLGDRLAGIEPHPDAEPLGCGGQCALHRHGAFERAGGRRERRDEAVPGGLHLGATVGAQRLADDPLVDA